MKSKYQLKSQYIIFFIRPKSSKEVGGRNKTLKETSPLNIVKERAVFADRINTLELEAADDVYTPSQMNDGVLPEAANELSSGKYIFTY